MVWEQLRLPCFGDSKRQACHVPFLWARWEGRAGALGLWGGCLGSAQEGLAGPGHSRSPRPQGRPATGGFAGRLWVLAALTGLGLRRARGEASASLTSLLLPPGTAQAACGVPWPPGWTKSIHLSAERLLWYRFQQEEVSSQPAGSQWGCGGVFWVKLCRELLKCFVLMMMMIIIFFPTETFLE